VAQRIGPALSCRVAISGTFGGQSIVNVFWCQLTSSATITQADLDTWTAAIGAAYKLRFASLINSNYTFALAASTLFVDGTPLNIMQSQQSLSGAATGGADEIAGLAAVISWQSSAYWRGGKPRTYIPMPSAGVSVSAPGQLGATYITNLNTGAGNFRTDVNALTGGTTIASTKLGFVSFFSGGLDRVPPLFFAFTGQKIHPRIASQRRRNGKWLR
jgi:hypothetical protein